VHRSYLEFGYDPPGCALTDEELDLLRTIGAVEGPVMFQAEGRTVPAHIAFDDRVDVLRRLTESRLDRAGSVGRRTREPWPRAAALLVGPSVLYAV
jgi:hypothetical protein